VSPIPIAAQIREHAVASLIPDGFLRLRVASGSRRDHESGP
jgi:hypothetical protein